MKVFVRGSAKAVELGPKEYIAAGGQGAIYARGNTAYKIYGQMVESPPKSGNLVFNIKPEWALPAGRIDELATLQLAEAVKPEKAVLDAQGVIIGHTMKAVRFKYVLASTLPRAFRDREKVGPEIPLRTVQTIQSGISSVHKQGFHPVDIQPANFLESEDFREIAFIDVDSWATPHYGPTGLLDSARDWLTCPLDPAKPNRIQGIGDLSDWFSFAMLAFEIFIGIHPFKGKHPDFPKVAIRERMLARKSVLNPEVRVPADAVMPLTVIPPAYRAWFDALFEQGKRIGPPTGPVDVVIVTAVTPATVISAGRLKAAIITLPGRLSHLLARSGQKHFVTPRMGRTIALRLGAISPRSGLRYVEASSSDGTPIMGALEASDTSEGSAGVLIRIADQLCSPDVIESPARTMLSVKLLAQVKETAQLFPGCCFQDLLGVPFVTLVPEAGLAYERRLLDLVGRKIIDARLERTVLQIITEKAGVHERLVYRFTKDFASHDLRVEDISATGAMGLNFAVLDTGLCVQITEAEDLEVFGALPGQPMKKVDLTEGEHYELHADGARLIGLRGDTAYHLTLT